MKTYKTFSLDYDIAVRLSKESNASQLINNFLRNYFASEDEEDEKKVEQAITAEVEEVFNAE